MPRYEFRCEDLHCVIDVFTLVIDMKEQADYRAACPNCGKPARRILSTFNGKFGDTRKFHHG